MALIQGINVASPVVPFDTADTYPSHRALYGAGGLRTVATEVLRDSISQSRCEEGMMVYCQDTGLLYQLKPGYGSPLTSGDWTQVQFLTGSEFNFTTGTQSVFLDGPRNESGSASDNISIGFESLKGLTTGQRNIAIGSYALYTATTSSDTLAIGYAALSAVTGSNNISVGSYSGAQCTGENNTFIGYSTGICGNSSNNVCVGIYSGFEDPFLFGLSGNGNVFIGASTALSSGMSGPYDNNILIGYNCTIAGNSIQNSIGIGSGVQITESNQVILGNSDIEETTLNGVLVNNDLYTCNKSIVLDDEESISIDVRVFQEDPESGPFPTFGWGQITVQLNTGALETTRFYWETEEQPILLDSPTNIIASNTDNYFCIYYSSGNIILKNRLGYSTILKAVVNY